MRRGAPLVVLVCLASPVVLLAVLLRDNPTEQQPPTGTSSGVPSPTRAPRPSPPSVNGEVAHWTFEGPDAATVTRDVSGHGNEGKPTNVTVVAGAHGRGYRFDGRTSHVVVSDAPSLNPGSRDFSYSVTVRFREPPARRDSYDLLRKGNTASLGGGYKVEIVNINGVARARCTTRDALGRTGRTTPRSADLADGRWHVITCARRGSEWSARVDGSVARQSVPLGSIGSIEPLTLGAKVRNLHWEDWFPGDLDDGRLSIG